MSRFATKQKPFSWSYSKLKNFETCPYRHQQIDLDKVTPQPESDELRDGNEAHDALAKAVTGAPLPVKFRKYQPWVDRLTSRGNDEIFIELQLAIDEQARPVEWFAHNAWFRAKVDYLRLVSVAAGTIALAVDYKTGKRSEDSIQLALSAACLFAHYPHIVKIRTEFVWLKEPFASVEENTTREDFTLADMADLWRAVDPRVEALKYAWDTKEYPPNPGRLCRQYCPVTHCQYHGKRL